MIALTTSQYVGCLVLFIHAYFTRKYSSGMKSLSLLMCIVYRTQYILVSASWYMACTTQTGKQISYTSLMPGAHSFVPVQKPLAMYFTAKAKKQRGFFLSSGSPREIKQRLVCYLDPGKPYSCIPSWHQHTGDTSRLRKPSFII